MFERTVLEVVAYDPCNSDGSTHDQQTRDELLVIDGKKQLFFLVDRQYGETGTTTLSSPDHKHKELYRMEKVLWYLIAGTRGGKNRASIIQSLEERPRNANQLADHLDLDYNTVRYHLDMLIDHDVIETGGDDSGKMYFLTDQFEHHRDVFDRIVENIS